MYSRLTAVAPRLEHASVFAEAWKELRQSPNETSCASLMHHEPAWGAGCDAGLEAGVGERVGGMDEGDKLDEEGDEMDEADDADDDGVGAMGASEGHRKCSCSRAQGSSA